MNAQEYFLVSKMVEHLNVVNQYKQILHDRTYDEIFKKDGHALDADLEDLRRSMLQALENSESVLLIPFDPMISVAELGQGVNSNSSMNIPCVEEASRQ